MLSDRHFEIYDDKVPHHLIDDIYLALKLMSYYIEGRTGDVKETYRHCAIPMSPDKVPPAIASLMEIMLDYLPDGEWQLEQILINAYHFGDVSWVHVDHHEPGGLTVLYYANAHWDINWGAETIFTDDSRSDILASVHCRPGRFLVFDQRIPHAARMPSRDSQLPRFGISIKLADRRIRKPKPAAAAPATTVASEQ